MSEYKSNCGDSDRINKRDITSAIVERSPNVIFVIDSSGEVVFSNERGILLLGRIAFSGYSQHKESFEETDELYVAINNVREDGVAKKISYNLPGNDDILRADIYRISYGDEHGVTVIARDITHVVELHKKAKQAEIDVLSGLCNRASMDTKLSELINTLKLKQNEGKMIAIQFLDVDDFKQINDGFSHQIGDEVIRAIGERLNRCTAKQDIVARYGGDEFVVAGIFEQEYDIENAAGRIKNVIEEPILLPQEIADILPEAVKDRFKPKEDKISRFHESFSVIKDASATTVNHLWSIIKGKPDALKNSVIDLLEANDKEKFSLTKRVTEDGKHIFYISIKVSVGVVIGDKYTTLSHALSEADREMYVSKQTGGNVRIFSIPPD